MALYPSLLKTNKPDDEADYMHTFGGIKEFEDPGADDAEDCPVYDQNVVDDYRKKITDSTQLVHFDSAFENWKKFHIKGNSNGRFYQTYSEFCDKIVFVLNEDIFCWIKNDGSYINAGRANHCFIVEAVENLHSWDAEKSILDCLELVQVFQLLSQVKRKFLPRPS